MAGNGGGTGYSTVSPYVKEMHDLVMRGFDGHSKTWTDDGALVFGFTGMSSGTAITDATDTYDANPSVMRFVYEKALTDDGGNPYQGISAYAPDGDLSEISQDVTNLKVAVDAIDPDGDWEDFIDAAVAKAASALPELSTDVVFREAIASALEQSGLAAASVYTDAQLITTAIDNAHGHARDKASDVASDAQANADQVVLSIRDKAIADGVVGKSLEDAKSQTELVLTDLVARAEATSKEIITDITTEFEYIEPSIVNGDVETVMGEHSSNSHARALTNLESASAIGAEKALSQMTAASDFISPISDDLMGKALNFMQSSSVNIFQESSDKAITSMTAVLGKINPDTAAIVMDATRNAGAIAMQSLQDAFLASLSVVSDDVVLPAVTAFRKRAFKDHVRGINRFAGGMSDINAVNSSAFVIGMALLESDFTDNVTDFQSKLELQLSAQALPLFLQTFQGLTNAYLESYNRSVATSAEIYRASLPYQAQIYMSLIPEYMKVYVQGMSEYISVYTNIVSQTLDSAKAEESLSANYTEISMRSSEVKARLSEAFAQIRSQMVQSLSAIYTKNLQDTAALSISGTNELTSQFTQGVSSFINNRGQSYERLMEKEVDAVLHKFDTQIQTFMNSAGAGLESAIKTKLVEKDHRVNFVNAGAERIGASAFAQIAEKRNYTSLRADTNRIKIVAKNEEYDKNLEFDVMSAGWDLTVFQTAGNIMSAVTGSVVPKPDKPSRFGSALGGALSGGAAASVMGASVTGAGLAGPLGLAIGAGVGLLAGATQ